jgi:hypothetical protein
MYVYVHYTPIAFTLYDCYFGIHFNREDYLFLTRNILRTYFGALESYFYYFLFTQYYEFGQNNF